MSDERKPQELTEEEAKQTVGGTQPKWQDGKPPDKVDTNDPDDIPMPYA